MSMVPSGDMSWVEDGGQEPWQQAVDQEEAAEFRHTLGPRWAHMVEWTPRYLVGWTCWTCDPALVVAYDCSRPCPACAGGQVGREGLCIVCHATEALPAPRPMHERVARVRTRREAILAGGTGRKAG
jgi:hypothetical protein